MKDEDNAAFSDAFEQLKEINGACDMKLASELVHTINPRLPIWDRGVAKEYFGIDRPEDEGTSVHRFAKIYEDYSNAYYAYMNSPEGSALVNAFDDKFPDADITDAKKIDFIIR